MLKTRELAYRTRTAFLMIYGKFQALKDKRTIEWSKKVETPVEPLNDTDCTERIRFLINGFKEHMQIVEQYF